MSAVREFKVTKQNVDEMYSNINQEIDSLSNQFKKVYLSSTGHVNNHGGEITVRLSVSERV